MSSRSRLAGFVALLVLGCLFTAGSISGIWVNRWALSPDDVAEAADTFLSDDSATRAIADQIASQTVASSEVQSVIGALPPGLQQAGGELLADLVQAILRSDAFRAAIGRAVELLYGQLVRGPGDALTLDLRDAVDIAESALGNIPFVSSADVPPGIGTVVVLSRDDVPVLWGFVAFARDAWWVLGLLALGTFGGAVALDRNRLRALTWVAVAIGAAGALLAVFLPAARALTISEAPGEAAERILEILWSFVMDDFLPQAIALAVIGGLAALALWWFGARRSTEPETPATGTPTLQA